MKEIPKAYNPQEVEDKIYKIWEESGAFNPDNLDLPENAEKFSIAMPPPNVTGVLHLGHALENTLMDTMIRFQRMRGKRALLIPGTDHAAVATQAKVESDLIKSGKYKNPRQELGRERLLEIIREYAEKSKATILSQIRRMGTSCDWDRLAYTFDEPRNRAVNEVFDKMYRDGLIYRGYRVVNWSVKGQSTCSDEELVYVERPAKLYTFKYSKDFPISIATTRPETKLGDTAVAINPDDERYKKFIGQEFTIDVGAAKPLRIKIIADESIDRNFGTGAVGVTPAHSMIDFEMYEKQKAKGDPIGLVEVIGKDGEMSSEAGRYKEKSVEEARKEFVEYLYNERLMEKEEDIVQNVGTSDRFGDVVEVLPMTQWFMDVNKEIPGKKKSLKDLMRDAVTIGHRGDKKQKIKITPDRFEKIYLHWIDNLRDWCISRQIWWGHRIPAWYNLNYDSGRVFFRKNWLRLDASKISQLTNGPIGHYEGMVLFMSFKNLLVLKKDKSCDDWNKIESAIDKIEINNDDIKNVIKIQQDYPGVDWLQDPDTLDTWFSSGLWTFSTLGWPASSASRRILAGKPEKSNDLKTFHPTSWIQMGSEIVFFWMARMILMSTYAIDQIPFENVYIHGILRDKDGRKFSKSLGNGIDPIDIIGKYGTDALRLSLITGTTPGNDMKFYEEKVEGYRNFVNKLWNISRYIIQNQKSKIKNQKLEIKDKKPIGKTLADKWILEKADAVFIDVTKKLESYEFSAAAEELKDFTWSDFADWYIEISKIEKNKDEILIYILRNLLIFWHPFIPFGTESIWSLISADKNKLLMTESWPTEKGKMVRAKNSLLADFEFIKSVVTSIRNLRSENKIEPAKKIKAVIASENKLELIKSQSDIIKSLCRLESLDIRGNFMKEKDMISAILPEANIYLPIKGLIDVEKETEKTKSEIDKVKKYIGQIKKKLDNKQFADNAPLEIVEKEREKLRESEEKLRKMEEKLKSLL